MTDLVVLETSSVITETLPDIAVVEVNNEVHIVDAIPEVALVTVGEAGPAGPAGATGATGPQGPAGPAGSAGDLTVPFLLMGG